jgi:AcrR family transcriptional regulator
MKARILTFASEQFFTLGYSRVSTSELADHLGVSKATLYKFFPSKEALLHAVIDHFFLQVRQEIESISAQDMPGSLKVEQFLRSITSHLSTVKTVALQDMQRSMPTSYTYFEEQRRQTIRNTLLRFFEERVAEGVFRQDLDQALVVQVLIAALQSLANPEFLSHTSYSFNEMCRIAGTIILEGNLTEEGRHRLKTDAISFQPSSGK